MRKLKVSLKFTVDQSYPIFIGKGIFGDALINSIKILSPTRVVVITDSNLMKIYMEKIQAVLKDYPFVITSFPAGEAQKNLQTIQKLFSFLAENRFDRKSLVLAFGGGVTGDMAGFLASVYMRGISYIQIPTSLLAMADSSIGGKTGIDTIEGKNLMGSFYQPKAVIIDTEFIKSLPKLEFTNGMAEIIKHAIIEDKSFFGFLHNNQRQVEELDGSMLSDMISWSCRIKSKVVQLDQKEAGLRQILNYGHTLGHAIEKASNYQLPHGYALAFGMVMEAFISKRKNLLSDDDFYSIRNLIQSYHLLDDKRILKNIIPDNVVKAVFLDKKNVNDSIKAVMIKKIGQVWHKSGKYTLSVSPEVLKDSIIEAFNN